MKVAILAGGAGKRLVEETELKPKALIEIGGRPIIWHIMKHYSYYGYKSFIIALGYKGDMIKQYMAGQRAETESHISGWDIELIDTGETTNTGGRIKRLASFLGDKTFMLTWNDGLSDININDLLNFHRSHGKLATVTAVNPPSRFGHFELNGDRVLSFSEKPRIRDIWINGAFFVLEPGIFDYIAGDDTRWEEEPLERLAKDRQLMAFRHPSFWQCMDTVNDKRILEYLWQTGAAPWKVWK